jgi:hypothetical protein
MHEKTLGSTVLERCNKNPLRIACGDTFFTDTVNLARSVGGNLRLVTTIARMNRNIFDTGKTLTATENFCYPLNRDGFLPQTSQFMRPPLDKT